MPIFGNAMEGSWKLRRKYGETAMEKSKNKYEYAEDDVIRVNHCTHRHCGASRQSSGANGSRRGSHSGLRRLLGGVPCAHERVMAISGAHGVGAGVG